MALNDVVDAEEGPKVVESTTVTTHNGAVTVQNEDYAPDEAQVQSLKKSLKTSLKQEKSINKAYLIWGTNNEDQQTACVGVELLEPPTAELKDKISENTKRIIGTSFPDFGVDFVFWPLGGKPKVYEEPKPIYLKYNWWTLPGGKYIIFDFGTDDSPYEIIGNSAYCYLLVRNVWAISLSLLIVAFQLALFIFLWDDNDTKVPTTLEDWQRRLGFAFAIILLALRLLPKIGQAMSLINTSRKVCISIGNEKEGKKKYSLGQSMCLLLVGLCELTVASFCVAIGVRVSLNTTTTLTRMITNAVVALWVEAVDEHFYTFLKFYSKPSWFKHYKAELEAEFGPPKKEGLSDEEIKKLKEHLKLE